MVHCSLGHDTTKIIDQPEWWPQDIKFSNPLIRPSKINDVSNFLLLSNTVLYHFSNYTHYIYVRKQVHISNCSIYRVLLLLLYKATELKILF